MDKDTPDVSVGELVLNLPDTALIPAGATFYEGPDDTRCRLTKADGTRCTSTRMRATGLCPGHSGHGAVAQDPAGASRQAHAEKRRRAAARATLGISARRASQPLQAARIAAQMRANDYARAIVDDPLDDADLGSVARQQAAIRALELLYPQVTATLDVELPENPDGLRDLGWEQVQALAAQHLGEGHPTGTDAPLTRMVEPSTEA